MKSKSKSLADKKILIVDVEDDLKGKHSERFRSTIYTLTQEGNYDILVNFSGVKNTDSLGIGVLIMGLRLCSEHGGHFKLVNVSPEIRKTLRMMKIEEFFEFYDDEAEAIQSFDE